MKKIILLVMLCVSYFCSMAQPVSTGFSVINGVDQNWFVTPANMSPTYVVPYFPNYWEPTTPGSNLQWISPSPNQGSDIPGIYTFERKFNIPGGTTSFSYNLKIAEDDSLVLLELVPPSLTPTIPLTVVLGPSNSQYRLSRPITGVVNCPEIGDWTIRAKVDYIDALGGFLLSGKIMKSRKPVCDSTCKFSLVVGGVTGNPFACGSTIKLNCKTKYDFNPQLVCKGTNGCASSITNVTLNDATGTTPSWANSFVHHNGNGTLNVPAAVSGTFTLTYSWGINGAICGSCSYTIVISCLDCKCKKDIVSNYPFINIPTFPGSSNISTTPSNDWFATSNSPQYYTSIPDDAGACDSGFVSMWGNQKVGEQITQTGLTIIAGHQYQIKFAGKLGSVTPINHVRFRFTANSTINGLYGILAGATPSATMGVSPDIFSTLYYATYTLPIWTAPPNSNYSVININPENEFTQNNGNKVSWGRIDNVCITDVTPGFAENSINVRDASSTETKVVKISASPNPTKNSFRINGLQNKTASLDIINMQGYTLLHYKTITEDKNFGETLPAGIYLLRLTFKNGETQSLKVIKN